MAKTKISEFSSTAGNNTDIDSINIAEGCAPSGINNAIRELMAQLKDFQTGAAGDSFNGPVGTTTAAAGAFTNLTASGTLGVTGVATLGNGAVLGTPASVTLTNGTGLPIATGVSGLGTGIATALAVNVGSAGAPVINGGALGTPSSGTVTNLTGTASININGTVGATTANTGAFTTLTTSGAVTHNAGTANGVAYLNGSKVLTTGSALTFDGTNFKTTGYAKAGGFTVAAGTLTVFDAASGGLYGYYSSGGVLASYSDNSGTLSPLNFDGSYLAWRSAGSEKMRLTSTGLGIGTSSPSQKLSIVGVSFVGASFNGQVIGDASAERIRIGYKDGTPDTGLVPAQIITNAALLQFASRDTATGAITFATGTGIPERMRLDSSGNVGIGTSSPSGASGKTLAINGGAGQARLALKNTSTGDAAGDGFQISLDSTAGGIEMRENLPLYFTTNNTERARIDSSGNLGIGTSSPQYKLTVDGVVQARSAVTAVTIANGATATVITPPRGFSYINVSRTDTTTFGLLLLVFRTSTALEIVSTVSDKTSASYSASASGTALQITNSSGSEKAFYASCVCIAFGTGD